MRKRRIGIAILSALAVIYIAGADLGRSSPGPLAAVHARETDLNGFNSCSNCHGGWFRDMTEACLSCHQPIGVQIDRGRGLHGSMDGAKSRQCALCHSDHHGGDFALVNRASFGHADVEDPSKFDHRRVGFDMAGKHLEQECSKCHEHADADPLPKGEWRFGGLDANCAGCHKDPHEGTMVKACADCHGQVKFDALVAPGHEKFLPLTGGHADRSCRRCHQKDAPHALEVLGAGRGEAARRCVDCHTSPHRERFTDQADCQACHLADHASFREDGLVVTAEQHARSGYPLAKPHDKVSCEKCHDRSRTDFIARYPGRGPEECRGCHEDPHGGQFDQGAFAAQGCVGCHARTHFAPHEFTVQKHARTDLALTGRHAETDCAACHKDPPKNKPRVFADTPASCADCHEDAHRGSFRNQDCGSCHATVSFSELPHPFDHEKQTGFAVTGAHAQENCTACHRPQPKADEAGRTFGWAPEPKNGCASCHVDPHRGSFDVAGMPAKVGGHTGCARCHVEVSFRALERFDHGKWTGFTLDGAHQEAGCAACHKPRRKADKTGRTWGRARGARCENCHDDPHAGQFRTGGATRCDRCHRSAAGFARLAFQHDLHSRFALGKAHGELACTACHKPFVANGRKIARYRPLNTQCASCHGDQKDPLRRKR